MPNNDDCNARALKAMRQRETPLNQSGGGAQKVRSPNDAHGMTNKSKSLNVHCDPYSKR
jgi:hypothetical protein